MKPKTNFGDKQNSNGFDAHPENIGGGRPKGVKNRATILRKWIDVKSKFTHPGTGEEVTGTLEDEIYLALLSKGLEKDVAAIKEINDTLYGKIKEHLDLSGSVILPITGMKIIEDGTDS